MDADDELASDTESSAEPDVENDRNSDAEKDEHKDRARITSQSGSVGDTIRSWITTIGVVIALAWGVCTFIYKEILEPESAPVNVSIDLGIQAAGIEKDVDPNTLSAVRAYARGSGSSICSTGAAPALLGGLADQHVVGSWGGTGADAKQL
jgi:hypothetical protein